MADLIDIAIQELDTEEYSGCKSKYGAWYGMNGAPWCHMFVSYCAEKAGVGTDIVPKTASTSAGMAWYKGKKRFKYKGKYTPQRNDLVYFKSAGASHVGIVEYVSGSTLHTIEGNTSNAVRRRTHPLSEARITGYGVVSAYINSSGKGIKKASGGNGKSGKQQLDYLEKSLKKISELDKKQKKKTVPYDVFPANRNHKVDIFMIIQNGKKQFEVPVEDGAKVTWERKGTPGKLTFQTVSDDKYKIKEGNGVLLFVNGKKFFYGFVFTVKSSKDFILDVTVYDQLRYLKNKDTYMYTKKTTSALIRMIAKDFRLRTGTIDNTKYAVSRIDDNAELFSIIQNSVDETMLSTGKLYTLYDDCGALCLRTPAEMKVNDCLIDAETAEDYTYSRSIDSEVYNQIKLGYENKETGTLDVYISKHSKNINKWGVLQYFEKIDNPEVAKLQGKVLLKLYNRAARRLSISNAFGNPKVRAGSLIPVLLQLEDRKVCSYMLVNKVTHTFSNFEHKMDLDVSGGEFDE